MYETIKVRTKKDKTSFMGNTSLFRAAAKAANQQQRNPCSGANGPGKRPVHQRADGPHGGAGNAPRDTQ